MAIEDDVRRLQHIVMGNGAPGLSGRMIAQEAATTDIKEDLDRLGRKLDNVKSSVDELVRDRRDERARREGSKDTLNWLKWGVSLLLAIVLIGGSLGLWRTNQQWQEVQQQLQRIPALPE